MNIAVYYNLPPGGAKRILFEQIKYLSKNNRVDIYKLNSFNNPFLSPEVFAANVYIYKYKNNYKYPFIFKRLAKDLSDYSILNRLHKKIAKDIDSRNYDLVFVHTDVLTEAPYILRHLKTKKVYYCEELLRIGYEPVLNNLKGLSFPNRIYEIINRKIRKEIDRKNAMASDAIFATSKFMREKIKKEYKKDAVVCYPGVDLKVFKKYGNKKEYSVLFMGNKTEIDGFDTVREAVDIIPQKIRPALKILNFGKNNKPKVANDTNLARIYSSSLATLCFDHEEPFGLKVIESMACGTPVIAVDEGGYKETVINKRNGYLVSRNPEEISKAIIKIVTKRTLRNNLSLNAISDAKKFWNWEERLKILEENLNKLKDIKNSNLLISAIDSGGWGGSENFLYQLSKELHKIGFKSGFLVVKNKYFCRFLEKNNYSFLYKLIFRMDIIGDIKGFIKFFLLFPISLINNIYTLSKFKKNKGTSVLLTGFSDKILLSFLSRLLNLKVYWLEYAPLYEVFKKFFKIPQLLYKLNTIFCHKLIVPTVYTKNEILKKLPNLKNKTSVIPCGINILSKEKISEYKKKKKEIKKEYQCEGKKVIVQISRIEKGKGQELFIECAKYINKKYPDTKFLIVGGGDTERINLLLKRKKVGNEVKVLGFVDDIYKVLTISDVFVFPTIWKMEGFGIAPLEAMNMKVPVVASLFGPVPEVLRDGAILVKPKVSEFTSAICNLLDNKSLARRYVNKASEMVREKYDIGAIALKYKEFLF